MDILNYLKKFDFVNLLAIGAVWWSLTSSMNNRFNEIDARFAKIEQELAVIKTVLIMKQIMPADLAAKGD